MDVEDRRVSQADPSAGLATGPGRSTLRPDDQDGVSRTDEASGFAQRNDIGPTAWPAPTEVQAVRERVFRRRDVCVYAALSLASLVGVAFFLACWVAAADWTLHPVISWILTLSILALLAIHLFRWSLLPGMKRPVPRSARPGLAVGVVTTFVPGDEPLEMLEETVRALVALDYPHETWVLDEGDDDHVKSLCRRLGAYHFSRKLWPQYQAENGPFQARCKHGNYNAWLHEVGFNRYEIISAFDPDHIPEPCFLSNVLGHFDDPEVGYVQVPQVYYNMGASFIARGAAEEVRPFHSCVQMASDAGGYPIIIGGHNTHRVAALKEVGGFAPHYADDIMLTLLYRRRGWHGVYVPQPLARGLAPVDWVTYLRQQMRWTHAVLDLKLFVYPRLSRGIPLGPRLLGMLQGISFVKGGVMAVGFLATVSYGIAVGYEFRGPVLALLMSGAACLTLLALCDVFMQRFFVEGPRARGLRWRAALVGYAKWPFVLRATLDAISRRRRPYGTTVKVGGRSARGIVLWPHALTIVAVLGAWTARVASGGQATSLLGCGLALVILSVGLISTEFRPYPDPYPVPDHKGDRSPTRETASVGDEDAVGAGSQGGS